MSVSLMSVAFRAPLPTTQKFVLVALCDTANDQGECYPSITTLMDRCSLSERAVQSSIRALEQLGYLRREFRAGRSTVYWMTPEPPHHVHPAPRAPRTTCTPQEMPPAPPAPTPAPDAPPPPHVVHPTPAPRAPITIKEPSVEPSGNRKRRAPVVTVEVADLMAEGFDAQTAADFIAHKTGRKAPLTPRAWADHLREAAKAGWTPQQAAEKTMARNWSGFESRYVVGDRPPAPASKPARAGNNQAERAAALQRALGYRDEDVIDA